MAATRVSVSRIGIQWLLLLLLTAPAVLSLCQPAQPLIREIPCKLTAGDHISLSLACNQDAAQLIIEWNEIKETSDRILYYVCEMNDEENEYCKIKESVSQEGQLQFDKPQRSRSCQIVMCYFNDLGIPYITQSNKCTFNDVGPSMLSSLARQPWPTASLLSTATANYSDPTSVNEASSRTAMADISRTSSLKMTASENIVSTEIISASENIVSTEIISASENIVSTEIISASENIVSTEIISTTTELPKADNTVLSDAFTSTVSYSIITSSTAATVNTGYSTTFQASTSSFPSPSNGPFITVQFVFNLHNTVTCNEWKNSRGSSFVAQLVRNLTIGCDCDLTIDSEMTQTKCRTSNSYEIRLRMTALNFENLRASLIRPVANLMYSDQINSACVYIEGVAVHCQETVPCTSSALPSVISTSSLAISDNADTSPVSFIIVIATLLPIVLVLMLLIAVTSFALALVMCRRAPKVKPEPEKIEM